MRHSDGNNLRIIQKASRLTFWASIFLMLSSGLPIAEKNGYLFKSFLIGGIILFGLNWIIPVLFLMFKKQIYAFAWSRGLEGWEHVNEVSYKDVPLKEKILIYMRFVLALVMYVVFFYLFAYIFYHP
jgi:hypothetical protein